jgi:hypothetical protein
MVGRDGRGDSARETTNPSSVEGDAQEVRKLKGASGPVPI